MRGQGAGTAWARGHTAAERQGWGLSPLGTKGEHTVTLLTGQAAASQTRQDVDGTACLGDREGVTAGVQQNAVGDQAIGVKTETT